MAYAHKVVRVTFHGTCWGGAEEWSTGLFLGQESADAEAPDGDGAAAIAGYWQTWFTTSSSKVSSNYKCDYVKLALLNTDGKTDLANVVTHNYPTALTGGYTGGQNPPQIALVATLQSNVPRGLASKGRMYLPGIGQGIQGDGKIIQVAQAEMATNFQTFMNQLRNNFAIPGQPILASEGRIGIGGSGPINKLVTSVKIGNVYDTQRRRRNQLVESYEARSLTA